MLLSLTACEKANNNKSSQPDNPLKLSGYYGYEAYEGYNRDYVALKENNKAECFYAAGQGILLRGTYKIEDDKLIITLNENWSGYSDDMYEPLPSVPKWEVINEDIRIYTIIDENTLKNQDYFLKYIEELNEWFKVEEDK